MRKGLWLPVLLVSAAMICSTIVAYGIHPNWGSSARGLAIIVWSRRLQWPLVTIALFACVGLVAQVIASWRSVWWLMALGPVLALFYYRFSSSSINAFGVIENPQCVSAQDAQPYVSDDDWVVGVRFGDTLTAYPYAVLYRTPVVIQQDHEKRMVLLWSAFANRAVGVAIDRDLKGRDLEIVSMPANALLIYNTRLGEFINGLKGLTTSENVPVGFRDRVPTIKTTWRQWRAANPETKVMVDTIARLRGMPAAPVLPYYPMPIPKDLPTQTRIALIPATQPVALISDELGTQPVNLDAGRLPVLAMRDAASGIAKAYDRRVDDLAPQFRSFTGKHRPGVAFVDSDTSAGWNAALTAIDGEPTVRGKRLEPIPVEDDLYWGVMKYWYPELFYWRIVPTTPVAESDAAVEKVLPKKKLRQPVRNSKGRTSR